MAYFWGIFFANMGGGGGQNYFQRGTQNCEQNVVNKRAFHTVVCTNQVIADHEGCPHLATASTGEAPAFLQHIEGLLQLSGARGPPQFLKKRSENAGAK